MKKFLAILLALALCMSMMAGCNNDPVDPTGNPTGSTPAQTDPGPTQTEPTTPSDPIAALAGSIYYFVTQQTMQKPY